VEAAAAPPAIPAAPVPTAIMNCLLFDFIVSSLEMMVDDPSLEFPTLSSFIPPLSIFLPRAKTGKLPNTIGTHLTTSDYRKKKKDRDVYSNPPICRIDHVFAKENLHIIRLMTCSPLSPIDKAGFGPDLTVYGTVGSH
jgi:hypothetical protein